MKKEQYILTTGEKGEAQLDALDRTFGKVSHWNVMLWLLPQSKLGN